MDKHALVSGFLDALARAVSGALSETGPEEIQLDWSLTPDADASEESWTWWSAGLSTHAGASCIIGAPEETWERLGRGGPSEDARENAFALIGQCFGQAVTEQFGAKAAARDNGSAKAPDINWTRISIVMRYPAGQWPPAGCVLNPEFEQALAARMESAQAVAPVRSTANASGPSDLLMQVQVPVSVSFGGTQIRIKDLLNLATGSVVELDQSLHDHVEVRVNDRLIARGEVVAVDGNYGVRVLELVSGEAAAPRGAKA
jgi:flagellar motor switch protein FliN/FliY